jgi:hypothetical protein
MNLLAVLLALAAPTHVVTPPTTGQGAALTDKCAKATSHLAGEPAILRGDPGKPKKLTELPDAQTFAAVYRLENGCAVPVLYGTFREVRPSRP